MKKKMMGKLLSEIDLDKISGGRDYFDDYGQDKLWQYIQICRASRNMEIKYRETGDRRYDENALNTYLKALEASEQAYMRRFGPIPDTEPTENVLTNPRVM